MLMPAEWPYPMDRYVSQFPMIASWAKSADTCRTSVGFQRLT
jgi:hypothetical protein